MSLLCQRVTAYRADGSRRVYENCSFSVRKALRTRHQGTHRADSFALILRPPCDLRPGDRVMEGIGPEQVDWHSFLPEAVEGLVTVEYVQPFYWNGQVTHVEAGGRYDRY